MQFPNNQQDANVQIFKLDMNGNKSDQQAAGSQRVFSEKLGLKGAFLEKDFSDITFKVQGKEFYGHKIILTKASQHFCNMFKSSV